MPMKGAWRERYGGAHVVEVRDIPKPVPAAGEVLVRVEAASVNRADLDAIVPRWALVRLFFGLRRPRVKRVGLGQTGDRPPLHPRPGRRCADLRP